MPQVRQQSVRNVDCAVREADQPLPQPDPGSGRIQRGQTGFDLVGFQHYMVLLVSQRQGRIAEIARYPDIVARPRAASAQRVAFRHFANDGHADVQGPLVVSPPISSTW